MKRLLIRGSLLILLTGLNALALAADDPFAGFKLLGETTDCTIQPNAEGNYDNLSDFSVRAAYNCARHAMQGAYIKSGFEVAEKYLAWANFSTSPYKSPTHGNRYVNNYANDIAAAGYGQYESMTRIPVGSVLAKDSFYVEEGKVMIGALYLMEKKNPGYNPRHNDWAYTMILPDGTVFASRGSAPSPSVKFCGDCHREVGIKDSLFFVPERYRFDTRR